MCLKNICSAFAKITFSFYNRLITLNDGLPFVHPFKKTSFLLFHCGIAETFLYLPFVLLNFIVMKDFHFSSIPPIINI